ncbi:MAG: hypothetical protein EB072_10695 [Betaproteobacteria bacterium]|nr:hypothetical protein [Betaproteobacteria bacterium]
MTTIRSEGLSVQDDDLRQHGMSEEGLIAWLFMLGLVQTDQGVPLYHEVRHLQQSRDKKAHRNRTLRQSVIQRFSSHPI